MIYDAVIVGAGPAGSTAGYLLAKNGKKVLILERNKKPVRKVCGEYLCPQGVQLLNEIGAGKCMAGTLPIFGMKMVSPLGTVVMSKFPGTGAGCAVNRKIFDQSLLDLAVSVGADVKLGAIVENLESADGSWRILTSYGEFHARFVIGADGRQSKVSRLLDNDVPIPEKRVAIHAFVNASIANERFGEMHMFSDGAYIGVDPTGELEVNLSLVANAARIQELGGPGRAFFHYLNLSRDLQPRFGVQLVNTPLSTAFPIQHRTKTVIPRAQIALIGDAAGFVDPLTGEGLFNAILSARLLSLALCENPAGASVKYARSYVKYLNGKIRLNRGFQWLLKRPQLVEKVGKFLLRNPRRADTFIGIVGNVYSPVNGLMRMLW